MAQAPRLGEVPDKMDEQGFWNLFGNIEHEQLDFKKGTPRELQDLFAAMAMTDGGLAVLGVTDERVIEGCPLSQNTFDRVTRFASVCNVEVQLKEVSVGDLLLTVVAVPEVRGRIVTTPDGRLLRRVGSECLPLTGDAMARFVRERSDRPFEEEILPKVDYADFDLKLIDKALKADGRPAVRRSSIPRALVDLGVALQAEPPSDVRVMIAAALLYSQEPTRYVAGATVQAVRRDGVGPGPGPAQDRQEFTGPIPELLSELLEFVAKHTRRFQVVSGIHREVVPEYPTAVLREAILNALAHRDYSLSGATVDISIWDDRIEIHSPGPLPGHITLENIREEHYSRNRKVMLGLRALGLVEEYGEGVDRMFLEMESRLMEPPIFSASRSSVTVILRNRFLVDVEDQAWLAALGQMHLTAAERRVLVAARREGSVTPRRIRALSSAIDAEATLSAGVAKGLLVRVGERGGTRYVLSDEVVMRAGTSGLEAQNRKRQMLLDEIHRQGSLSTSEGAQLLDDDPALIRHLLNDLVSSGVVVAKGQTRGRRYYSQ